MNEDELPDFNCDEDCVSPEGPKRESTPTETIDTQGLWPSGTTASGSFDLSEIKGSSLGKLLDALPMPAAVIDRWAVIAFSNTAFGTANDGGELRGRSLFDSLRPENSSDAASIIHRVLSDRKARGMEALLDIKGRTIWGKMHVRSIRIGEERGALVIVEDLTAEKSQLVREKAHRLELKKAHGQLEQRVKERTKKLVAANARLKAEIVERLRVEQRLLNEKEFSGMVLDSLPGIFYLCDEHGRLLRWNKNLERTLGYSADEIAGKDVLDFFSGKSRQAIENGMRHIMAKGEFAGEEDVTCKDGSRIPHLFKGVRVTVDQKQGFLGMGIDISDRKQAEKALRESEMRYRTLFDESRDGIFIMMKDGSLVDANQSCLDILGSTREQLIGADFTRTCVSPEDWRRLFEEITTTGSVKDYAIMLKRRDGSIMDCRITATTRTAHDGTLLGYHGILRDVTAEVAAETKIREQNVFLNSLLEALTHPLLVVDINNYNILHANSAARTMFVSEGATCYAATRSLSDPCASSDRRCPIREVIKAAKPVMVEQVNRDEQGIDRHVEIHAYPIVEENGNISKVIKYIVDVTHRKQTEQALKESEERMRLLIESSPIGIAIIQDARCLFANRALAETFGYTDPADLVGLGTGDLFPQSEAITLETQVRATEHKGASSPGMRATGMRQNGEPFEAAIWGTAIEFQQKPCLLLFITDMSKEKALKTQLFQAQKMEAIGTLAGGIAHDFNNLLTVIQGFAELVLLEKHEGDSGYEDLQKVLQAARNGADLVRSLMTFSRKVESEFVSVDLNDEVRRAEKLLRRTIPRMIEIVLRLEEPLYPISGNPGQIEQILLNLAVNAHHAMPDGGRLLIETKNVVLDERYCRERADLRPGPHVVLKVTDNGHGMTPEIMDHIFEPFFSTKKAGQGTGLGLATVFGIVKSHYGDIMCTSEPGAGTSFDLYFPAIDASGRESGEEAESTDANRHATILLVDDEEPIRDLGTKILSRAGYHVMTASGGPEALEIYGSRQDDIALIVLDVIMPVMSGAQCLEKLLEINPDVKVLVASGFGADGEVRRVIESGSKGFVSKPFQITELLTNVQAILDVDKASGSDDGTLPEA